MRPARDAVENLAPYRVEQFGFPVKLNQNEAPIDLPRNFKRKILHRMAAVSWNRYPPQDPIHLKSALSRHIGLPQEWILLGNGSNELIQALMLAHGVPGDRILVVEPGFSLYPRLAAILNLGVIRVPMQDDGTFDAARIVRESGRARIVFLSSPNNPTGALAPRSLVIELLRCRTTLVVVDEAYIEFCGATVLDLLPQHGDLVILRTFSKAYGLAGLRAGYLMAHPERIQQIEKTKLPFSLGVFQQTVLQYLLERDRWARYRVRSIGRWRDRLYRSLRHMPGIDTLPSQANFIYFTARDRPCEQIDRALRRRGVLVRLVSRPDGGAAIRVTVGHPRENERFLKSLAQALREE